MFLVPPFHCALLNPDHVALIGVFTEGCRIHEGQDHPEGPDKQELGWNVPGGVAGFLQTPLE